MPFIDPDNIQQNVGPAKAGSFIDPDHLPEDHPVNSDGFFSRAGKTLQNAADKTTLANAIPGAVEAFAGGMGEMGNAAVSGLYGTAKSFVKGTKAADEIENTSNAIRNAIPYSPETESGKAYLETLGILPDAAKSAGSTVFDKTGSPLLAAGTETLGNALMLGIGPKALKRAKVEDIKSKLDEVDQTKAEAQSAKFIDPDEATQGELFPKADEEGPAIQNSPEQIAEMQRETNPQADLFDQPSPKEPLPTEEPVPVENEPLEQPQTALNEEPIATTQIAPETPVEAPDALPEVPQGTFSSFKSPSGQSGAAPFINDIAEGLSRLVSRKPSGLTPQEEFVSKSTGNDYIPRGEDPATALPKILAEGKDGAPLWTHVQSGLGLAADKVQSGLMRFTLRHLTYAEKQSHLDFTTHVKPLEKTLTKLSKADITNVFEVMKREMFNRKQYTPEELSSAGVTDKQMKAYKQLRDAQKDVLAKQNAARVLLGKEPIKGSDAYLASMWQGNWHLPVKDKAGKLVGYLKMESKGEVKKAMDYLRNNHPDLDIPNEVPRDSFQPENLATKMPRDVMGAYQDMLSLFHGDEANLAKQALEHYVGEKGYKFRSHDVHFENKSNIRFFQGDRPWLTPEENAYTGSKAQIRYLKDAYQWGPLQEALSNIRQVISNPDLIKQQPNNMELTKAYVGQAMGLSKNLFRAPEQALAKAMGHSPAIINKYVGDLKSLTYLTQLGMSGGYMIATPLQAFLLGPALHMKLTNEGFKYNPLTTAAKSIRDFVPMLSGTDKGMSPLGKEAYKYAKDNGIVSSNIFDEYSGLGEHRGVAALKQTVGLTIGIPERIARSATFMSFVHHLSESGLKGPELMQKAEDATNNTLTNFRRSARPLAVDAMGQMGELAYTYKSPLFNMYNNLGVFARDAAKGRPGPLLMALGMSALMGGATNIPFMQEADEAWDLVKKGVASLKPEWHSKIAEVGLKQWWIQHMNELSANSSVQAAVGKEGANTLADVGRAGLPSALTGTQLASRFSAKAGDVSNPMGNIAPAAQELREMGSIGKFGLNSTITAGRQAIYDNASPMIKGTMENTIDQFKGPKMGANQAVVNPTDIAKRETTYVRTPHEQDLRYAGLTSLNEAETKNSRYLNDQIAGNYNTARDASMGQLFNAVLNKDKEAVQKYAISYVANHGDGDSFNTDFNKKVEKYAMTPDQRKAVNAASYAAIMDVVRGMQLQRKH